jgi:nucleoside-diphosphate-sugar epimerase
MDDRPRRTALVTGATGFVGRELVARLVAAGRPVRALVRDRVRAAATLGDRIELVVHELGSGPVPIEACADVETVFHLAGHAHAEDEGSGRSDRLHERVTVEGTRSLLDAARAARAARFVFLSSVKAIGEGTDLTANDGSAPHPATAYGRAKRAAETLVLHERAEGPVGVVLRSPLVYGPGVKGNLRQMMRAVARRRFPPLPSVDNRRSMVDVRDLVAALLLLEVDDRARSETFIVTDGEPYSTRRIYEAMCAATGTPIPRWSIPMVALQLGARCGDAARRILKRPVPLDTERLAKLFGSAHYSNHALVELGFRPLHRLESSLPAMVEAWREEDAP